MAALPCASAAIYERENPGVRIVTESSGEPVGQISLQGTIDLIVQSMGSGVVIGFCCCSSHRGCRAPAGSAP